MWIITHVYPNSEKGFRTFSEDTMEEMLRALTTLTKNGYPIIFFGRVEEHGPLREALRY